MKDPRVASVVSVIVLLLLISHGVGAALAAADPAPEAGTLELRVMLVTSDLSVRPAPLQSFVVAADAAGGAEGEPAALRTDLEGRAMLALAPGRYRLRSERPVELQGRRLSWDVAFEIVGGSTTRLELSNDNAVREEAPAAPASHAALYERFKAGVFKVISDSARGSGFLVDEAGLVLTNHHVIADAIYLAVKLDDRHKHGAVLLAADPQRDLAVLRLHPDTVRGRPVLELADDSADRPAVTVGESVLAIGSPLTAETILTAGLVSKVERESLLSDVNINPGNSGGPLFDSRGRVVGVNTFGLQGATGPGVSGVTRIYLARPLVEEARRKAHESEPPSSRPLPVESAYRFSPERVRELAVARDPKPAGYHLEAGKIDVQVFTPVLMAANVIRAEREADRARQKRLAKKSKRGGGTPTADGEQAEEPSRLFYEWQKNGDNFRPVVRIRAVPEVKMTAGSAFVVAMVGTGAKFRFKTDFLRMELLRDGQAVEPIHPGRVREVVNFRQGGASMRDVGHWGLYEFPPEAFAPGAVLTLHIWEQGEAEPKVVTLSDTLVRDVRGDLGPYFEFAARGDDPGNGQTD